MKLESVGYGGQQSLAVGPGTLTTQANRTNTSARFNLKSAIGKSAIKRKWYINAPAGIEQGFSR